MTRTGLCLAALGALIASAAAAQGPAPTTFRVISPIFGQLVTFSMPTSFVVVAENKGPFRPNRKRSACAGPPC